MGKGVFRARVRDGPGVTCSECGPLYTPDAKGQQCVYCPQAHCDRCAWPNVCEVCAKNYSLVSPYNSYCATTCNLPHCAQCVEGDPTRCAACREGFYFDNSGACQPCALANCGACGPGGSPCQSCAAGYGWDRATAPTACVRCGFHCMVCQAGNPSFCLQCSSP